MRNEGWIGVGGRANPDGLHSKVYPNVSHFSFLL